MSYFLKLQMLLRRYRRMCMMRKEHTCTYLELSLVALLALVLFFWSPFIDAALLGHLVLLQQVSYIYNDKDVCLLLRLNDLHGAVCDGFHFSALHMSIFAELLAPPADAWQASCQHLYAAQQRWHWNISIAGLA